jgi:hypothetical protein
VLPGSGLVAAMAAVDRYLQRCSCTCGSSASTPGCSSFELSNTALGLHKLRKRHGKGKQLLTLAATRLVLPPQDCKFIAAVIVVHIMKASCLESLLETCPRSLKFVAC